MLRKFLLLPTAIRELGLISVWRYAKYQLLLRSGWLRLQTPAGGAKLAAGDYGLRGVVTPANEAELKKNIGAVTALADEILNGKVRLFGSEPRSLKLNLAGPLQHWTQYHGSLPDGSDIKPIWEAGRFGWATALARVYWLTNDDKYAEGFWARFEEFDTANPPNLGPHWSSAQEVALRAISWAFCYSLIADAASSTAERKQSLAQSLAQHAERIPPTLDYALAQNNNHLLSEAAGLLTVGAMLLDHPKAAAWRALGLDLFNLGMARQIHEDGAYAQHSANYHRLMLQLSLWVKAIAPVTGEEMAESTAARLSKANAWLARLLDADSGGVPNLGPNDGAYILPLTTLNFRDYRPVLQAASVAFGGEPLAAGDWDDLRYWLGIQPARKSKMSASTPLRLDGKSSWAYLRTAQFHERPGHADQLHLDLWWRGHNVAMDAGTYLYNAPMPWDNALASTRVHNTLTINDRQQMRRAGRFLWLERVDARGWIEGGKLIAEHDGYRALGLTHRREVERQGTKWVVRDQVLGAGAAVATRVHWLLPDWPWNLDGTTLRLTAPEGEITMRVETEQRLAISLVRAGDRVAGNADVDPVLGWVSHTYGEKQPALSLVADVKARPPILLTTTWDLS
jgi:hypothetical protein